MSKVFSAHSASVDGSISGRTPDGDEEFEAVSVCSKMVAAPGVTHLHYEVVR